MKRDGVWYEENSGCVDLFLWRERERERERESRCPFIRPSVRSTVTLPSVPCFIRSTALAMMNIFISSHRMG